MQRQGSALRVIARIFIAAGVLCVLFAIGYEAVGYPWRTLFTDANELNIDRMPDPTPPDIDYINSLVEDWENPYDNDYTQSPEAQPPPETSVEITDDDTTDEPELPGQDDGYFNNGGRKPKPKVSYPPVVLLGAVKIPKLDVSVNLIEGDSTRNLLAGAGHVSSTPAIGREGNVVVAGHRVTRVMHPFRYLDKMEPGDKVILKNDSHTYTYSTIEQFIVSSSDNWVMGRVPDIRYCLTLVTCHPVGSAKQRLILRAKLIDVDGITPEEFYGQQEPPDTDIKEAEEG